MKTGLNTTGISWFEKYFSILLFAVRAGVFKVVDVRDAVLDGRPQAIRSYLSHLVRLGYLEKVSTTQYVATEHAKQLFGVQG